MHLFIYDEIVQEYTEKYKEKKIKQMKIVQVCVVKL